MEYAPILTADVLQKVIKEGENTFVDFKREYHKCPVELVHDILCLANAQGNSDRYCIYGIENNSKKIMEILRENRKTEESIIDILKNSNISRLPEVKLQTLTIENCEIDVLIVRNLPHKPYFMLKNYYCPPEKHAKHKGQASAKKK